MELRTSSSQFVNGNKFSTGLVLRYNALHLLSTDDSSSLSMDIHVFCAFKVLTTIHKNNPKEMSIP